MRQIGTIDNEHDAQRFAAYMVTQGCAAHAEADNGEWAIWVRDENHVDTARESLEAFRSDPSNDRYQGAEQAATEIQRERQRQREQGRKNIVEMRGRWGRSSVRRRPLTLALVGLSILVTLTTGFGHPQPGGLGETMIAQLRFYAPSEYIASDGNPLASIGHAEAWRLVTPIFLHLSHLHLIFNMIMLFSLGGMLEHFRGTARFAGLVVATAVLSNLGQEILPESIGGSLGGPPALGGGMSGVIYGIFGYLWMKTLFDPASGIRLDQFTVIILVGWLLLCMTGFMDDPDKNQRVANVAHVVGIIVGLAVGYLPLVWKNK